MHRPFVALAALVLAGLAGCSASPQAAPTPTTAADAGAEVPADVTVVPVTVTRPATPTSIDPAQLPAKARAVGQMPFLSADEKVCANFAIKASLDADPTLVSQNGKLAGAMGASVVACTGPQRAGAVVADTFAPEGGALTAAQQQCIERVVVATPDNASAFLAAILITNPDAVLAAAKPFETACGLSITGG